MDKEKTCGIDYEAEYHRMCEENQALQEKHSELLGHYRTIETECVRMKAQLEIVYLIFGNKW